MSAFAYGRNSRILFKIQNSKSVIIYLFDVISSDEILAPEFQNQSLIYSIVSRDLLRFFS